MKFKIRDKVVLANGKEWSTGEKYRVIEYVLDKGYYLKGKNIITYYDDELLEWREK